MVTIQVSVPFACLLNPSLSIVNDLICPHRLVIQLVSRVLMYFQGSL